MKEGYCISRVERISFNLGVLGHQMIFTLFNAYIFAYYTDYLGINAIMIGTMFALANVWDGINDIVMGSIIDKTRTKWGKLRPFLAIGGPLTAISLVMLFNVPSIPDPWRMVWIAVTYVVYGMSFTILDVPFWSLTATMTTNEDEKVEIIRNNNAYNLLAHMMIGVFAVPVIRMLGAGTDKAAFTIGLNRISMVVAAIGMVLILNAAYRVRERVPYSDKRPKLKDTFRLVFTSKPLRLCIMIMGLSGIVYGTRSVCKLYYATYVLGDTKFMSYFSLFSLPFTLVALASIPLINKWIKADKKSIFIGFTALRGCIGIIYFLAGRSNPYVILFFEGLSTAVGTIAGVYMVMMLTSVSTYIRYTQNISVEGVIFSSRTFVGKVALGMGSFISGIYLTVINFQKDAVVQTASVSDGLFLLYTLLPAGVLLFNAFIFRKFPITNKVLETLKLEAEGKAAS